MINGNAGFAYFNKTWGIPLQVVAVALNARPPTNYAGSACLVPRRRCKKRVVTFDLSATRESSLKRLLKKQAAHDPHARGGDRNGSTIPGRHAKTFNPGFNKGS